MIKLNRPQILGKWQQLFRGRFGDTSNARIKREGAVAKIVPALFLHIQKTAGTSIVNAAAGHYGIKNICSHGDFVGKSPSELAALPFVSGHFGFNFARDLLSGRFSFTFLRNPTERVLSFYYFCKARDPQQLEIYRIAREHALDDFLCLAVEKDLVRRSIWNSQVWRLASGPGINEINIDGVQPKEMLDQALANIEMLSFVGFSETFNEDAEVIIRELYLPHKIGVENVTKGRPRVKDHPPKTIKLIEEMTQLDQMLYDAAWQSRKSPTID